MRFVIRIVTGSTRSLRELLCDQRYGLEITDGPGGELVVWRSPRAVTGLRFAQDKRGRRAELPLFAGPEDLALAQLLLPEIGEALGARFDVRGARVTADGFESAFEDLGERIVRRTKDEFLAVGSAPDGGSTGRVFAIEGRRRPYYLGRDEVHRAAQFDDYGKDALTILQAIIAAIQELGDETLEPAAREIRTPDGAVATYAFWDPTKKTLLPPCDFVLLAGDEPSTFVCIASGDLARVVTKRPGFAHGARFDDRQWLIEGLRERDATALAERARAVGKALVLPPGTL